jgi:hypothetical protein
MRFIAASLFVVICFLAGCGSRGVSTTPLEKAMQEQKQAAMLAEVAERDFRDQLAAIAGGSATTIESEHYPANDATLAELAKFPGVTGITFRAGQFSDAGLAHLAGLKNLTDLNLNQTDITDEGLKQLAPLTKLESLRLGSSKVTSQGLANLSGLTNLKYLILQDARITDEGLAHLKGLKKLESLYIEGNQVSDEAVADLKKSFDRLHVHW